jgi:hypothetical protein
MRGDNKFLKAQSLRKEHFTPLPTDVFSYLLGFIYNQTGQADPVTVVPASIDDFHQELQ